WKQMKKSLTFAKPFGRPIHRREYDGDLARGRVISTRYRRAVNFLPSALLDLAVRHFFAVACRLSRGGCTSGLPCRSAATTEVAVRSILSRATRLALSLGITLTLGFAFTPLGCGSSGDAFTPSVPARGDAEVPESVARQIRTCAAQHREHLGS